MFLFSVHVLCFMSITVQHFVAIGLYNFVAGHWSEVDDVKFADGGGKDSIWPSQCDNYSVDFDFPTITNMMTLHIYMRVCILLLKQAMLNQE